MARAQGPPASAGTGISPDNAVPPLDPLPTPTTEQPGMYGASETELEATLADSTTGPTEQEPYGLCKRFLRGYPTLVLWFPRHLGPLRESDATARDGEFRGGERSGGGGYESPDAPRRAPPSPWDSPPFPTSEYQGYPLIGVPPSPTEDPMYRGAPPRAVRRCNQG